jgi:hypothetical protein
MANVNFELPINGLFRGLNVEIEDKNTSEFLRNVRPTDVGENKIRLGQRPALDKWGSGTQIGAAELPVVSMCVVAAIA